MPGRKSLIQIAAVLAALLPGIARANVAETYGFGSRNAALAGAGVSWGAQGYSAYFNPAMLAARDGKNLKISWGLLAMNPSFTEINDVIVENDYVSDKTLPEFDDVDVDYRSTIGQALGISLHPFPESLNLSFGLTTFLPLEQVAYMDTGEAYIPEYVLYRARTQRPQIDAGLGFETIRGLNLGVGVHMAFALTSTATLFLQTDEDRPSSMRFASSLKPKAVPYYGLLFDSAVYSGSVNSELPDARPSGSFAVGLVFRHPVASSNFMKVKSGARVFGSFAALDFTLSSASALYYDPMTVELGWSFQAAEWARTYIQFDWQRWSKFQQPSLSIEDPEVVDCEGESCGIKISPGANPTFDFRDIVVPRIGQEFRMTNWTYPVTLRLGYGYKPTILKTLSTGAGNFLDPPKHMLSGGVGIDFPRIFTIQRPWALDFHLAYHRLFDQRIDKEPGDETGAAGGDLKIGAPGYNVGGNILGGGVSLTLGF